jgi:hypothetical protein
LVEHWDGVQWSVVASPNLSTRRNELFAVSARAANDIWAVGYFFDDITVDEDPLIEHWDGTAWTAFPHQNFCAQTDCGVLLGVTAIAANDAWAVGSSADGFTPLIVHWNGAKWSASSAPARSARYLNGVSGSAMSAPVAVGTWAAQTAIVRYGPPQFPKKGPTRR